MAAGDDDKAWLAAFIRQMSVPGQGADGHFVPLTAAEIETRAAAILAREAEEDHAAPTDLAAERAYVATLVSTLADRIAEHFEAATSDCCCVAEHLLLGAGAGRDGDDDEDNDDEREAGDDEAAHAGASPIAAERADCADSELLTRQTAAETTPVEVLVPAAAPSHAPAHDRCVLAQWRVLQQQNNPSCGYYVLFNGLHFAAASGAADPATRNAHLAALRDPVAYWRFYWTCYQLLEAECERRGNEFYPWTKAAVATRVMEREYMQLLCERFQRAGRRALLQQIRPAVRLVPVPECRESLTGHLGWERARMLHSHIQHLRRSPHACVLFLLGVVDHWVCLAVNKVAADKMEFVLMDSLNNRILGASPSDIWGIVQEFQVGRRVDGGKPASNTEQKIYLQQMMDIGSSVELLVQYIAGDADFLEQWLRSRVVTVLDSFDKHVLAEEGAGEQTSTREEPVNAGLLSMWLTEHYHPRLVEEYLLEGPGADAGAGAHDDGSDCTSPPPSPPPSPLAVGGHVPADVVPRLCAWIARLEATLGDADFVFARDIGAPFLARFCETIARLADWRRKHSL